MPAKKVIKGFSVEELAEITGGRLLNSQRREFNGVSTDTRSIRPGNCFFAIEGENFDGHKYITEAFKKGAACAVVSEDVPGGETAMGPLLKVSDTVRALGDFAAWYRQEMHFKVVAVTGSAGKTTTRKIIHHALSPPGAGFSVHQSPKNYNNFIGLPLTILSAEPENEIIVAEIGTNKPGEIVYLANIASPDIAVITNVHPAHLEGFGSLKDIIREKTSIHKGLRKGGKLLINAGFKELISACEKQNIGFISFGSASDSNIKAESISRTADSTNFKIEGTDVLLPLPGKGNLDNALAAWAVCKELGLGAADFAGALKSFTAVPMRTEMQKIGSLIVLDDSYNANPASMKNAVEILNDLGEETNRRLVFICGDMAELGPQAPEFHKQLGSFIAHSDIRLLLTVGELAQIAAHTAKEKAPSRLTTKSFRDTLSLCNNLEFFIQADDVILVKASRKARLERAVEKLRMLFTRRGGRGDSSATGKKIRVL